VKGKIGEFSTDHLLKALNDLGQDIELRITPARKGRLRVTGLNCSCGRKVVVGASI
jgi:hypothetical protein